jgi:hypothetical protein
MSVATAAGKAKVGNTPANITNARTKLRTFLII